MNRAFLEGLGLEKTVINQIMDENGNDIERESKKSERLQDKVEKLEKN